MAQHPPPATFAYFDCTSGIAGDMAVAALLDLGFPFEEVKAHISAMGIPAAVEAERTTRGGLGATRYHVETSETDHHRGLSDCLGLVHKAALQPTAEALASAVFRRLAGAEAQLHSRTLEEVHFHEVGAADALADIVAFAAAYCGLGLVVGEAISSPLPFSPGVVSAAHGSLPLPAPATLALLERFRVQGSPIEGELVTPTGAALLSTVARPDATLGEARLGRTGHGAGARELGTRPNILRVVLCERVTPAGYACEELALVETNLDDMNPQLQGPLSEALFAAGALDVWSAPVQMKKGRLGTVVSALAQPENLDRVVESFFRESTSIGVRITRVERRALQREKVTVLTQFGPIGVKVARAFGRVVNAAPEFDEARAAAEQHGVPVKRVLASAIAAAEETFRRDSTR